MDFYQIYWPLRIDFQPALLVPNVITLPMSHLLRLIHLHTVFQVRSEFMPFAWHSGSDFYSERFASWWFSVIVSQRIYFPPEKTSMCLYYLHYCISKHSAVRCGKQNWTLHISFCFHFFASQLKAPNLSRSVSTDFDSAIPLIRTTKLVFI